MLIVFIWPPIIIFFFVDSCALIEIVQPAETTELTPSVPSQVPEQKTKTVKCTLCRAPRHNRKTCPTHPVQSWRIQKASTDAYGPYVESVEKKCRTKQRVSL